MGEKNKKNNNNAEQHHMKADDNGAERSKKKNETASGGGGGGGGKNTTTVVVLKADLHCEGCVSKVLKCIRSFDGVESADIGDGQRITVVGKVDPAKLREKVEQKTHKKVELISPQPKKNEKGKENDNAKKEEKAKETNKDKKPMKECKKSDQKKTKEKEPPVTTAVLKVHLHCEGCIQKINRVVTKTKGYQEMKIDRQKELVTVTGAVDMAALAKALKKHLKKDVEILPPPKKEAENNKKENNDKGGDQKEKNIGEKAKNSGGGGVKGKNGGGGKAKNVADGGGEVVDGAGGGEKVEANRMQTQQVGVAYPNPFVNGPGYPVEQFQYNPYAYGPYHAPQIFSDENPNACSVM